jgi:tetratricopeptide (TPR) repeat protein
MTHLPPEYPGRAYRETCDYAVEFHRAAVAASPQDAAAHASLAESLLVLWCYGFVRGAEALPEARAAADRAVSLAPASSQAHRALGFIRMGQWELAGAESELRRALDLAPHDAQSCHWLALFEAAMGRHAEAMAHSRRAFQLDHSPGIAIGYGSILYFAHEFDEMARVMEDAVAAAPDNAPAYDWLGMAYIQLGRFDDSIRVYRQSVELSGGTAEILAGLGHAYGIAGRRDEALEVQRRLDEAARRWYVPPVQRAFVAAGLGNTDAVFALLEEAVRQRSWELVFMREEPWLDHLHDDPRFGAVAACVGFPPR